jgi:NagD protein
MRQRQGKTMNWQGIQTVLVTLEGTLMHGEEAIAGAGTFVQRVRASGRRLLVITNHARFTSQEILVRLIRAGISVHVGEVYTAGMATATFVQQQRPGGKAFIVGSDALGALIQQAGYMLDDEAPDYVVLGDTQEVSLEVMTQAMRLLQAGTRCIMTNTGTACCRWDAHNRRSGRLSSPNDRRHAVLHRQAEPAVSTVSLATN